MRAPVWTREESRVIKKYYAQYGSRHCAKMVNRSYGAIRARARDLGIKYVGRSIAPERIEKSNLRLYTVLQVLSLVKRNPRITTATLASTIGRPTIAVTRAIAHARHLGVAITWDASDCRWYISDWGILKPDRISEFCT